MLNSPDAYEESDYELTINRIKAKVKNNYCKDNKAQYYYKGILEKGFEYVSDINIQIKEYESHCDLVHKTKGNSIFGDFYYEPFIFIGTNKPEKEDRMALSFFGLILEIIQGTFPHRGFIVQKDGRQQKIVIEKLRNELEGSLKKIRKLSEYEPKICFNRKCSLCSFLEQCKQKAIEDENLSLIEKITIKEISKLEKKGIFNITQLSYSYRPRRRKNSTTDTFKPELQALAIRTKKTYIKKLPVIERENTELFIDIESIPDENFFYLFGILIVKQGECQYSSYWANSKEDEILSWKQAINILRTYHDAPIYHYGSYEPTVFEKLSKRYNFAIKDIASRFINVNKYIFGKIYFPTYSNSLKELAGALGFVWSDKNSSGLQSIVWRKLWEEGQKQFKDKILIYNREDCTALYLLTDELTRIQKEAEILDNVDFVYRTKKISTDNGQNLHNQFDLVLELAHNEYDKKKIKVDFNKKEIIKPSSFKKQEKGYYWLGKKIKKPHKTVFLSPDKYCFKHKSRRLNKSQLKNKKVKLDLVFSPNGIKKTIIEYIGHQGYCPICNNSYASQKFREISRDLYGRNLKAWVVYQRVEIQLPFSKISSCLCGLIDEKLRSSAGIEFVRQFSEYYEETEKRILKKLQESPFVHVDETMVSILGTNQYVWVFSSGRYVILKLTSSRDSSIVKKFLSDYPGVLISDFYAGYDSVDCLQQKCWVHLIRDLNNDLWKNPFDKEYEDFVCK